MLLDSIPTSIGAAAVVPALMLLWLVVATDQRPEPPGFVAAAFLLGIVALFLSNYMREPFALIVHSAAHPWASVLEQAIFVAAIPEETAKVLLIAVLVLRLRAVHEPMDGLVYGAAVGLGFAAWENLGYLMRNSADWESLAVARDFLTVPFHGALGIMAGGYLAAARFQGALAGHRERRFTTFRLIALAWLVPTVLHSAFDFPMLALRGNLAGSVCTPVLQAGGLVVGFGSILLAVLLILRMAERQKNLPGARLRTVWGRGVWAFLVLGAAIAFAGAALVGAQGQRLWRSGEFEPVGLASGILLIAVAATIFLRGHAYLLVAKERPGKGVLTGSSHPNGPLDGVGSLPRKRHTGP
jgi:RsiW-degrading membrane proteinase PrsW (M82 family)